MALARHPLALRRCICSLHAKSWGRATAGLQNSDRIQRRYKYYIAAEGEQAWPIAGYYAEMLKKQSSRGPSISNDTSNPTAPATTTPTEPLKSQKEITLERARQVFGSKPGVRERRIEIDAASTEVAGIMVPPKPIEPDNCCMSGCVNCVWDMYRDEMEEWAEQSAKARAVIQARREVSERERMNQSTNAVSMDDDGGGSETNWAGSAAEEKLFDDIPVGIREFMKTEKKLKQRHKVEEMPT